VARILVVDDDERFGRTVHITLQLAGHEVSQAVDGQQALDAARALPPDLILLDWEMPRMNGIQMCLALRAVSSVPVVMFSGNRSNSKQTALDAGANAFLNKPFSSQDLLTQVESALER
jgi:DNA-binding response OmpR family regulator